jgi:glutathione peroxidase
MKFLTVILVSIMASTSSLYDIKLEALDGGEVDLNDYKGKKILFVNVASECGFTVQYEELQKLHETHGDKLAIIGMPCNQFGGQEPGSADEIASFCKKNYGVTFQLLSKADVKGANQHPLYAWLTQKSLNGKEDSEVTWNFQKYLVDENGQLLEVFSSRVTPMSEAILKHLK